MTQLSVNVNKLATLRNARGKNNPDLAAWAERILSFGAHGITVHPRPDERHVRRADVPVLAAVVRAPRGHPVEFNVEGYPSPDFMELIDEVRPDQVTFVPDPPDAITSNAGWDLEVEEERLDEILRHCRSIDVRTSLFVDPLTFTPYQESALSRLKPVRVELYTEAFAEAFGTPRAAEVSEIYATTARLVNAMAIELNAGHDLSLRNLGALLTAVPTVREVSIGHALVCEALEHGMAQTLKDYLRILGRA